MSDNTPKTTESDNAPAGAEDDVMSDPGEGAGDRTDWSSEGGATPSGPADTGDHTQ
ncbi:hypothetical protein [Mycobacterium sp. PS03-16]|uniref:hypothetical protein n=1 Tax=Mycobacterium sp. PS03-16 TaxID=2559611 RepID=UPI0014301080|nr:hypothetical protein [Mycobacterium sp. PS03-16]